MKQSKPATEKKTSGAIIVERHRPMLNKLTESKRRLLRQRAAELLYGRESVASGR